jgi:hypothetical protein
LGILPYHLLATNKLITRTNKIGYFLEALDEKNEAEINIPDKQHKYKLLVGQPFTKHRRAPKKNA